MPDRQAADEFLKDLLAVESGWKGGLRWGPLLAWSFLHGTEFPSKNGYLEPMMDHHQYMQVADDALEGIRFTLPQFGIKPRPRPPKAPSTLITKKFASSAREVNRALLQAHFMFLDMFHRFFKLDGLELFFESGRIMDRKLSVGSEPPREVAAWFLDALTDDPEDGGDQEEIGGDEAETPMPAVFMHISQEWFLIAEARHDYVMQTDYLHCRELGRSF